MECQWCGSDQGEEILDPFVSEGIIDPPGLSVLCAACFDERLGDV